MNLSSSQGSSNLSIPSPILQARGSFVGSIQDTGTLINFTDAKVTLGQILGTGSFGDVYCCQIKEFPGMFAIKKIILKGASSTVAKKLKSFNAEVEALENLNHPNVVRLRGYIKTEEEVSLIMDVYSANLQRCIRKKMKKFTELGTQWYSVEEITNYCTQILSGLDYLHSHGIAHRDLKSANILVRLKLHSTIDSLHLVDFGASKTILSASEDDDDPELCQTFVGTKAYMAPEIFKGLGYDGKKADIYAFGIVLFEILSGVLPKRSESLDEIPPLPSRIADNPAWQDLIQLYEMCCAPNPALRPPCQQLLVSFQLLGSADKPE